MRKALAVAPFLAGLAVILLLFASNHRKEYEMSEKVCLSAPWDLYEKKLRAMFGQDPDIEIEYDRDGMEIKLFVDDPDKAEAIEELLPAMVEFPGVSLKLTVVPGNGEAPAIALYNRAFSGNPAFHYAQRVQPEGTSNPADFVVFAKEVVQYYEDNPFSVGGMRSMLYQDLAKELFGEQGGVYFSTDVQ